MPSEGRQRQYAAILRQYAARQSRQGNPAVRREHRGICGHRDQWQHGRAAFAANLPQMGCGASAPAAASAPEEPLAQWKEQVRALLASTAVAQWSEPSRAGHQGQDVQVWPLSRRPWRPGCVACPAISTSTLTSSCQPMGVLSAHGTHRYEHGLPACMGAGWRGSWLARRMGRCCGPIMQGRPTAPPLPPNMAWERRRSERRRLEAIGPPHHIVRRIARYERFGRIRIVLPIRRP